MTVVGVILAAGGASRFGGAKQLAQVDGKPLIQHAVDAASAVPELDRVIVVLGCERRAVTEALAAGRAELVGCPAWREGMAASLRRGLDAAGDADWTVVMLADQPFVTAGAIARVVRATIDRGRPYAAVRGVWRHTPGHPVALSRALGAEARLLRGDEGARSLLRASAVLEIDVSDLGDPVDVNTREDLARLGPRPVSDGACHDRAGYLVR